jgi:hypothetical protein
MRYIVFAERRDEPRYGRRDGCPAAGVTDGSVGSGTLLAIFLRDTRELIEKIQYLAQARSRRE